MTEVHTRDEAISLVDRSLDTWAGSVSGILTQAHSAIRAAQDEVGHVEGRRAAAAAALEALMSSAKANERSGIRARLTRAEEALERSRNAKAQIGEIAANLLQISRRHTTVTTAQVSEARAALAAMSRALETYRTSSIGAAGSGTARGGVERPTVGGNGALARMGLSDVEVVAADLQENPVLDDAGCRGTFGKGGLTRADYRWAVQTWSDTVGPGLVQGKTRDDFVARDERTNAAPLRRTSDVYDLFLGSDHIRVERRTDGSLRITNGRHRLLIARELGVRTLPGEVT